MSDLHKEDAIVKTPDVRVRILTLQQGEVTKWHYHTHVTDNIFCIEGTIEVCRRDPEETRVLTPGERCEVKPHRIHTVINRDASPSKYLLVQGVGEYDFISVSNL
ncbi:MAG: cupin domain-containing protein [bacterium]|nr:cupin domain-containing protein [bacterium]